MKYIAALLAVLALALVTTSASAQDPVKVDPKHYKVEFENDQVRVLRIHYGVGNRQGGPDSVGQSRRASTGKRREGSDGRNPGRVEAKAVKLLIDIPFAATALRHASAGRVVENFLTMTRRATLFPSPVFADWPALVPMQRRDSRLRCGRSENARAHGRFQRMVSEANKKPPHREV